MTDVARLKVLIARSLEPGQVETIRRVDPRVQVIYETELFREDLRRVREGELLKNVLGVERMC